MNTLKLKSFFLQHRLFCLLACLTSLLFFSLSACYSSIQPDESRLSQTLAVTNPAEQAGQTAVAGPARSQPASSSTGRSAPSGIIAATASCLSPTKEENDQVDIQSATVCWPSESVSGTCAPTSAPTSTSLPAKTSQTTSSAALTVTKAESPPSTSSPATSSPNKIQLESDPGQEMFLAANALRQKNGLAPFKKASAAMTAAAQERARELAISFDHRRPDGSSFSSALLAAKVTFSCAAENIADFPAQASVALVLATWEGSPGHRANLLNQDLTCLAIGFYSQAGHDYWVQLFTDS